MNGYLIAAYTATWIIHIAYVLEKHLDRLVHDGDMFDNDRSAMDGDVPTISAPRQRTRCTPRLHRPRRRIGCDGVRCDMAMLVLPEIFERSWGLAAEPFWPRAIFTQLPSPIAASWPPGM